MTTAEVTPEDQTTTPGGAVCPVRFEVREPGGPTCPVIDLDPHGPEFGRINYSAYDELRDTHPVAWSTPWGGFWMMTDYAAVFEATQDDDTFSSTGGTGLPRWGDGDQPPVLIPNDTDPPDTQKYRRVTMGAISPQAVEALEPELRQITNDLIDAFIEDGEVDIVSALTTPVPAIITLRLLGIDDSNWREWVDRIHELLHAENVGDDPLRAVGQLIGWIEAELDRRTASGDFGDDMTTAIMQTPVNGELLTRDEQVRYIFVLLLGGMDTTAGLVGNTLASIDARPSLRRTLIEQRDVLESATEEFLRYDTPQHGLVRTLTKDTEFRGQQLKEGEKVMLSWAAANRDPAEFDNPNEIDIHRHPNRHLTFGVGAHRCLGSNLARTMFQVMLDEILNRLPDFELESKEVKRFANSGNIFGPITMRLRFTPGQRLTPVAPVTR